VVYCLPHLPPEGVYLTDHYPFGYPTYCGVAGHLSYAVGVEGEEDGLCPHPRRGEGSLYPRVPSSYDGYIELFHQHGGYKISAGVHTVNIVLNNLYTPVPGNLSNYPDFQAEFTCLPFELIPLAIIKGKQQASRSHSSSVFKCSFTKLKLSCAPLGKIFFFTRSRASS